MANDTKRFMVYEIRRLGQPTARIVIGRVAENRDLEPILYVREVDQNGNVTAHPPVRGWGRPTE